MHFRESLFISIFIGDKMKLKIFVLSLFIFNLSAFAQQIPLGNLAHTYSIIAVDSTTGEIGAAVQSHWFSVGSLVIWAEAGVGAVATQSFVNPSYGPRGLELMKSGLSPEQTLDMLLEEDEGRAFRQAALIDVKGNSVAYTGGKCIAAAGHLTGNYYSVQANLMLNESVWPAMENAFKHATGSLAERLVTALEAAQNAGGDIRGKQSAALLLVRGKSTGKIWEDKLIDLRVEDSPDPVKEIKRLLTVHRAYEHMNAGDLAVEKDDEAGALREYSTAEKMQPDNLEMKYWHAVALANMGKLEDALPIFRYIFLKDSNWKTLTPRLLKPGLLKVSQNELQQILDQTK